MNSRRPLEGIRVMDMTRVLAGPYCTMILRQLGAEVIKVERPDQGDDSRAFGPFIGGDRAESAYFHSINWEKKSLTVDLKSEQGKEIVRRLARVSDVLVENFRPGTLEKLGLGPADLARENPRLIFASSSGFGQSGPLSRLAAYDVIIQGLSGLMSITGEEGGKPVRVGASVADIISGMFTAIGILAALYRRDAGSGNGQGAQVDVAMLDSVIAVLENAVARYATAGEIPAPIGSRHPSITPFQAYDTRDSQVIIAVGNDKLWAEFLRVIERPDLGEDARFVSNDSRTEHLRELNAILAPLFSTLETDEWLARLGKAGIPCARVNNMKDVFAMEQVEARRMLVRFEGEGYDGFVLAGNPVKFVGEDDPLYRGRGARLGEHNREILTGLLGYSDEELEELQARGVL